MAAFSEIKMLPNSMSIVFKWTANFGEINEEWKCFFKTKGTKKKGCVKIETAPFFIPISYFDALNLPSVIPIASPSTSPEKLNVPSIFSLLLTVILIVPDVASILSISGIKVKSA